MKRWDEVRGTTAYIEVKTLKDEDKAKEQLIKELRQRNAELKKSNCAGTPRCLQRGMIRASASEM